jgi:copper chaperone CopZ
MQPRAALVARFIADAARTPTFGKRHAMQTESLKVTGMTCGGCTTSVTRVLKAITGVGDVKVSLSAGEATVQFDERLTSREQLKAAVKGAGFGVDVTSAGQRSKGGCCG